MFGRGFVIGAAVSVVLVGLSMLGWVLVPVSDVYWGIGPESLVMAYAFIIFVVAYSCVAFLQGGKRS